MKLAYELVKRTKGHTLYLLDEPTTGLHKNERDKILALLRSLIKKGHSVIAIEHTVDFIAESDYIIDLGPGAGLEGGRLVAAGTPAAVAANKKSLTGMFLQQYAHNN